MVNKARNKGTAWETAIVNFLQDNGLIAHRRALSGSEDKGDIAIEILPFFTIEAKNEVSYKLAEWTDEALKEARALATELNLSYGAPEDIAPGTGIVWAHKKGSTDPGDGYIIMSGKTFVDMVRDYIIPDDFADELDSLDDIPLE